MQKKKPKPSRHSAQPTRPRLWVVAGLAVALIIALAGFFVIQGSTPADRSPLEVSVAEALARREAGAFILDVRQPEEWAEYHIPGSTLIPLGELANRLNEVPRDREIVVVCRSGNRSRQGLTILRDAGFTPSTSMVGGLQAWKAAGYPATNGADND